MFETDLMLPQSIEGRAAQFRIAVEKVRAAHAAVAEAEEAAGPVCGQLERGEYRRDYDGIGFDLDWAIKRMRVSAWRCLLDQSKVKEFQSAARIKEEEEQLKRGDVPDFTAENIKAWLDSLKGTLPQMFAEAVKEVWNWLHPYRPNEYKTNARNAVFELGPKIILSYVMRAAYAGKWDVNYDRQDRVRALDNVFHLLDGKGTVAYPGDLCTALRAAGQEKQQECKTAYFRCRWYHNGNMHLEFLRLDLLSRLNAIAGDGTLKGDRKVSA